MNHQMKRYTEQDLEGSKVLELLFLWSWGGLLSQHIDVFTNQEVSESHTLGVFMKASFHGHNGSLKLNLQPFPLPRGWGGGA